MSTISVLLVDDNRDFLDAAAHFLATDPAIRIVGRAESGTDAIQQVQKLHPDLVLMDLSMPGMSGLEATRLIKALPDAPQVIVLTLHDQDDYRRLAQAARADAFVSKSAFGVQLLPLIHTWNDAPRRPCSWES